MEVGDIYELIVLPGQSNMREFCLILSQSETVRVGAWGYQNETAVLYRGNEIRVPTYFLRKLE